MVTFELDFKRYHGSFLKKKYHAQRSSHVNGECFSDGEFFKQLNFNSWPSHPISNHCLLNLKLSYPSGSRLNNSARESNKPLKLPRTAKGHSPCHISKAEISRV